MDNTRHIKHIMDNTRHIKHIREGDNTRGGETKIFLILSNLFQEHGGPADFTPLHLPYS